MKQLLALPLEEAIEYCKKNSIRFILSEVTSKKGPVGEDARVIAVRRSDPDLITLVYSYFKTDIDS